MRRTWRLVRRTKPPRAGFTTLPEDDRSTRYASDLAKGYETPVVH